MSILFRTLAVSVLLVGACTGSGGGGAAPTAPSSLAAAPLSGGAHLTWIDNSNNETQFMVRRMQIGVDAAMKDLAAVPFNATQYHDTPLTSGKQYMYTVMAMKDEVESAESNQVTFNAP